LFIVWLIFTYFETAHHLLDTSTKRLKNMSVVLSDE
jgi:hypothetical protein